MARMTIVRIYLTEAEHKLKPLLNYLHDTAKVRGVTVFRGISGFGASGELHESALLDLSLDLPITIEFFDTPSRIQAMMKTLNTLVEPGHLISWPIEVNINPS